MKRFVKLFSLICLCFSATIVAKAETINDNHYTIDTSTKDNLISLYENSSYSNYIISSKRVSENNYTSVRYYYLCLTDDDLSPVDSLNINSSCEELYTLYNNNIILSKNSNINISNSIYFTNNKNNIESFKFIYFIFIIFIVIFILFILYDSIKVLFKSRGGGLNYYDV